MKISIEPDVVRKGAGPVHFRSRTMATLVFSMAGWAVTAALLVMWAMLFRPPVLGGPASYVGVDGISMTPTFHNGDLTVVEHRHAYHIGDVIAYRIPAGQPGYGNKIIHRIVGGDAQQGFVTKGDHNSYADAFWQPKPSDILGKVWLVAPGAASWLAKTREPLPLALVVGFGSFVLLAWPSKRKQPASGPEREPVTAVPRPQYDASKHSLVFPSTFRVGWLIVAVQLVLGVRTLVTKSRRTHGISGAVRVRRVTLPTKPRVGGRRLMLPPKTLQ